MNVTPKKPRGRPSLTPRQVPQAAPQIYLPSTPAPDPQPTAQAAPPKPMHQPAAPQPPPFPAPPLPPFPAINQEAAAAAQPPLFGPLALLPARNDPPLIGLANRVALHWDFMLVVNPDQRVDNWQFIIATIGQAIIVSGILMLILIQHGLIIKQEK